MDNFQKAREYYQAAIVNINDKLDRADFAEEDFEDSNRDFFEMNQMGPIRFILACRHYMRGMAGFYYVKQEFSVRSPSMGAFKSNAKLIQERKRDESECEFRQLGPLLSVSANSNKKASLNDLNNIVDEAKHDFVKSMESLRLDSTSNRDLKRSVLDFAIHIAFQMLELILYERVINGADFKKNYSEDIIRGGDGCWDKLIDNPEYKAVAKHLYMIKDLRQLQTSFDEDSEFQRDQIFSIDFANKYR